MISKSLEVLKNVGNGSFKDADGKDGVDLSITILSQLNNSKDLWRFCPWVLKKNPNKGMHILTSKAREKPLKPSRVIEFLQTVILGGDEPKAGEYDYITEYLWQYMYSRY
eukprot:UN33795